MLSGQKIVLAVTGSIAAYKSCELLRLLIKRGAEVSVIMTEAAQRFVTPLSFQALGAKKVYTGDWVDSTTAIPHIEATKEASLLLVAPATANILAKAAQGLADDLLSAAILAARCPVAYAPAMNTIRPRSAMSPSLLKTEPFSWGRTRASKPAATSEAGECLSLKILSSYCRGHSLRACLIAVVYSLRRVRLTSRLIRFAASPTYHRANKVLPLPKRLL